MNFESQSSVQSQWRCMICSNKLFWNKATIQQHLGNNNLHFDKSTLDVFYDGWSFDSST